MEKKKNVFSLMIHIIMFNTYNAMGRFSRQLIGDIGDIFLIFFF